MMFSRTLVSVPLRICTTKFLSVTSSSQVIRVMGGSQSMSSGDTASSANFDSFVKQEIDENCVVVFSKTTCGYCRMAKQVLDSTGLPYKSIEINQMKDGYKIQEVLQSITGGSTVPRVFVNGKFIGGGTETKALHAEGKLIPLIQKCNL